MVIRRFAALLARVMAAIAWLGAALSAATLAAMVGLILVEVVARNFFSTSLGYAVELVGYGIAAITFNSLAYALQQNALIRVSLVAGLAARRPLVDTLLQAVALIMTLLAIGLMTIYFWDSIARHFARGSVSETGAEVPLWLAEGVMLVGLALFTVQLLVCLLNLLAGNREQAGPRLGATDESWGKRAENVEI